MKRFMRIVCLMLVFCTILAMPAYAQSTVDTRASSYIASHETYLYKTGTNEFQVWFDVTACTSVTQIGVKEIEIYRSTDRQNWTWMKAYSYEHYPNMMDYNSGAHASYVSYSYATPGCYYKAYVTFYAKNSTGSGTIHRYTAVMQM